MGVYLVFKVTTSYEKLHQDNARSTERYVILWDVVKYYKILEIVVISSPRDNYQEITTPWKRYVFKGFLQLMNSLYHNVSSFFMTFNTTIIVVSKIPITKPKICVKNEL